MDCAFAAPRGHAWGMTSIDQRTLEWPVEGRNLDGARTLGGVLDAQPGPTLLVFLRHFG